MSVAVLMPYRSDDEHRGRAREFVLSRYAHEHPDWPIIVGSDGDGEWVKGAAVHDALSQTDADIVVIADADVWTDGLAGAVESVQDDKAAWAIPHGHVHRLTEEATKQYMAGAPHKGLELEEPAYRGVEGGGIVVIRRDVALECPFDPRFEGWGNGDESWSVALRTLHGAPARERAALVHLWHPHQRRATRNFGSIQTRDLRKRYIRARGDQAAMSALIEEAMAHVVDSPAQSPADAD